MLSVAPRADTLAPRPVDRGPDPPLVTPPLPAPGAAGVMAAGVVGAGGCQTRPAPPPLAPEPAPLLVGVAPLAAAGGVLGTATFARSAATRPPPPRVCGPPPPANGPGAAPPDWASRAFMRSLIDIVAMPSVASSDIDKWASGCERSTRGERGRHSQRTRTGVYRGLTQQAALTPQTVLPCRFTPNSTSTAPCRCSCPCFWLARRRRQPARPRLPCWPPCLRYSALPPSCACTSSSSTRAPPYADTHAPGLYVSVGAAL